MCFLISQAAKSQSSSPSSRVYTSPINWNTRGNNEAFFRFMSYCSGLTFSPDRVLHPLRETRKTETSKLPHVVKSWNDGWILWQTMKKTEPACVLLLLPSLSWFLCVLSSGSLVHIQKCRNRNVSVPERHNDRFFLCRLVHVTIIVCFLFGCLPVFFLVV